MKLLFNKKDFQGHWFYDNEDTNGFTEKIPPNTGYIFNEELDDWVLKQEPIQEEPTETE
jgi:hypothetical protein